ncbi:hypothetical protein EBB07_26015 [Paenibacillaceae bacterium]|nr:hypothetical protein EBB07_26015 [Paenibacillaceae bacterium]
MTPFIFLLIYIIRYTLYIRFYDMQYQDMNEKWDRSAFEELNAMIKYGKRTHVPLIRLKQAKIKFGGHQIRYLFENRVFGRVFMPIAERVAAKTPFGRFWSK